MNLIFKCSLLLCSPLQAEASMLRRQENVAEETNEMLAQLREEEETMRRISEHTNAIEEQMVLHVDTMCLALPVYF